MSIICLRLVGLEGCLDLCSVSRVKFSCFFCSKVILFKLFSLLFLLLFNLQGNLLLIVQLLNSPHWCDKLAYISGLLWIQLWLWCLLSGHNWSIRFSLLFLLVLLLLLVPFFVCFLLGEFSLCNFFILLLYSLDIVLLSFFSCCLFLLFLLLLDCELSCYLLLLDHSNFHCLFNFVNFSQGDGVVSCF